MEKVKMKAVFTIIEGDNLKKAIFRRVGTGFINKDNSINVYLDALPVSGALHIRDIKPKADSDKEAA